MTRKNAINEIVDYATAGGMNDYADSIAWLRTQTAATFDWEEWVPSENTVDHMSDQLIADAIDAILVLND